MQQWKSRPHGGQKDYSRHFLATGDITGRTNGYKAHTVTSLVGYDLITGKNCECINLGIAHGYIAADARITAIERDPIRAEKLRAVVAPNITVYEGDLKHYHPPVKQDLVIADLMCNIQDWIGEKLRYDIVPMLSARRSGIGINLSVQRPTGSYLAYLKQLYLKEQAYWDSIWNQNIQRGVLSKITHPFVPFTGIAAEPSGMSLYTFVGIHHQLRETDLRYRGCLRYRDSGIGASDNSGTNYMLSLRYDRPK